MKKYLLTTLITSFAFSAVNAQFSQGGVPYSLKETKQSKVETIQISDLDIDAWKLEAEENERNGEVGPYMVGQHVDFKIDSNNGTYIVNKDGTVTWKLEINVLNAKAIDLVLEGLVLPKGVSVFAYGETHQQVLGAYTSESNLPENQFILGPIVGDTYYLEFNFAHAGLVEKVNINVPEMLVYFRGFDAEARVYGLGGFETLGNSSPCNIDANCEETLDGWKTSDFVNAKDATAKIIISSGSGGGAGFCSGTLVNATGYNPDNCEGLFLTASHCDFGNGRDDEHFSNWRFYFNYQHTECNGSDIEQMFNYVQGAKFISRSNMPSFPSGPNGSLKLVQDFLALDIGQLPSEFNTTKVGWNRVHDIHLINADEYSDDYKYFIGFHHPGGNPKKQSYTSIILGNGTFNQNAISSTHWHVAFEGGCTEGGSSGSGLFDQNGNIIGVLSGGSGQIDALYSKISYGWENEWEQGEFPAHSGSISRLKEALDPTGSGKMQHGSTDDKCENVVSVVELNYEEFMNVYPNPAKDGYVNVSFSLPQNANVQLSIVDVLGRIIEVKDLTNVSSTTTKLDLSHYTNGIYFVVADMGGQKVSKKIILN